MLQQSRRLLQGYCSTHLFYFIAHKTTSAIKFNKTFILFQHLRYFIAHEKMKPQFKTSLVLSLKG